MVVRYKEVIEVCSCNLKALKTICNPHPGSPWIGAHLLRANMTDCLCELHPRTQHPGILSLIDLIKIF